MNILIIFLGLLLIAFIIWWFWLKKSGHEQSADQGTVEVIVDNGVYTPDTIKGKVGQPIKLRFIRKTESPCAKSA